MKGLVFTSLADMVEQKMGLELWDKVIKGCPMARNGAYTVGGIYPDEELLCLVNKLHDETNTPKAFLLRAFGEYLFNCLIESHPHFLLAHKNSKSLLKSVKDVIHRDVEKLYPGTHFPFLDYQEDYDNHLTIIYSSPRKLCFLAEGLIGGAAQYYSEEVGLVHRRCVYRGDEHCELELDFHV